VLLLDAVQMMMLIRAILSWFPPADGKGGVIRNFVYTVTEFFIAPVRALLDRFDWTRRTPIDISFLVTYLALSVLSTFFTIL
jgi:uncharacterized protein YggT (Ycf19 family)